MASEEIKQYRRLLLKKIGYTLLVVFLFLLILDIGVKWYDLDVFKKRTIPKDGVSGFSTEQQIKDYREATELVLYPYLMFALKPNFHSDTININSLGLRGPEISKKTDDAVRIVVLGGSGAMGFGASSDDMIFTKLLENKLNNAGNNKRYEVINAGLPAAISMQEFILISLKIIDLEPDLIIVYDGFNDMAGSVLNDRRPGYPWRFNELEKAVNISITKAFIRKRLMNYRPTKKIVELIEKKRLERIKTRQDYSLNLPAVQFYKKTLDRMGHLLKSYGIKPIFAYQPSLYFKTPRTDLENSILAKESATRIKVLTEMLESGKVAMQEAAKENNILFIDCLPVFNGPNEDIFFDTAHFGDNGQEILAQFLYEKLKDELL